MFGSDSHHQPTRIRHALKGHGGILQGGKAEVGVGLWPVRVSAGSGRERANPRSNVGCGYTAQQGMLIVEKRNSIIGQSSSCREAKIEYVGRSLLLRKDVG